MANGRRVATWALTAAALLALCAACAPTPPEVEPPVEALVNPPAAFSTTGLDAVPSRWWTAFDDPALDGLVEQSLRGNLDLAAAWERLREARAVAEQAGADLWPDVDAELAASAQRGSSEQAEFQPDEELRLGLSASYEVDLWGRIRSARDAERLRAEASREAYRAAALSLSAEVARAWFQLLESREQAALLAAQVEANEKVLQLLENRFGGGQAAGVDVLRQRQLAEGTREQRIVAESRREVLEHLLAVLLGRPPASQPTQPESPLPEPPEPETVRANSRPTTAMPSLPPLPATGLPAELVRRRPDVESAFLRLRAADRDLASAISARYPRLTLAASVSTTDDQAGDLFDEWIRRLAAGLLAPIFRGGELAAAEDRAEAVRRQRLYEYGQATLLAFQEVEDALTRERRQAERVASLAKQVEWADRSYQQLRHSYLNGLGDYIDVLLAQTDRQQLQRDLLSARRLLLEYRVALYRALAGGFATERESAEDPRETVERETP